MKVTRPRSDLEKQLEEQVDFLLVSAARYDAGAPIEAKRIALAIRILVHETAQSKSLLGQLGWFSMAFCDTALLDVTGVPSHHHAALVGATTVLERTMAIPLLSTARDVRWVSFSEWWNRPV